jgi:hypothetical protein
MGGKCSAQNGYFVAGIFGQFKPTRVIPQLRLVMAAVVMSLLSGAGFATRTER